MGFLRLFLALSVIAGHTKSTVFGFHGIGAPYAVNFFFIISGFYMAMVLNGKYKHTGPWRFYKSRALRLFPTYYIGLLAAMFLLRHQLAPLWAELTISGRWFMALQNALILGQDVSHLVCTPTLAGGCADPFRVTINPPAWSLAVELCFYLAAPFILKSVKRTLIFILVGCLYLLLLDDLTFPLHGMAFFQDSAPRFALDYYLYPSSFIFFGGGAMAYHLHQRTFTPHYGMALLTLGALAFTTTSMPFWHLLFMGLAIPVLFEYTAKNKLDRTIGELSYPAYILHYPAMVFVSHLGEKHPALFTYIDLGTAVALVCCSAGLIIHFTLDRRINRMRETITAQADQPPRGWRLQPALGAVYLALPLLLLFSIYGLQSAGTTPAPAVVVKVPVVADNQAAGPVQ